MFLTYDTRAFSASAVFQFVCSTLALYMCFPIRFVKEYMAFVKVNVFKDPVTDRGKKSKKGRLKLVRDSEGHFHTEEEIPADQYDPYDPTVSCTHD